MVTFSEVLVAANIGIILFFSVVITPIVFKNLPPEFASKYLRAFFPRLYITLFITSTAAAVFISDTNSSVILGIVAVLFLLSFWPLTPAINKATDTNQKFKFKVLHSLSVFILLGQLAAFLFLLAQR